MLDTEEIRALLNWHLSMGIDETVAERPVNRFLLNYSSTQVKPRLNDMVGNEQASPKAARKPIAITTSNSSLNTEDIATELAKTATTFEDLEAVVKTFNGCSLKRTATNLVFTDGNPKGRLLLIGEAPGAEEDRCGVPFVGPSGQLLDKMLASIGFDRSKVLITNTVFWRPPGNRTPTPLEVASCSPFIERLVKLMKPELIVPLGGSASKSLLEQNLGIGKLRGRWFNYNSPNTSEAITATPIFHPAYLLRTPAQKRAAWQDLLMIKKWLDGKIMCEN